MSTAARRCSAITRSYSSQSSCSPPAAVKIARSKSRSPSASSQGWGSSGPASSARPSTAAHCQPLRKVAVTWGRARRFASLTGPDRDQGQDGLPGRGMGQDAGVDQRRLDRAVGSQRRHHHQAALVAGQRCCFLKGDGIGACHDNPLSMGPDDAPSAPIARGGDSWCERGFFAKR